MLFLQRDGPHRPIEITAPVNEEVKVKPTVLLGSSRNDYYGSLSNSCRGNNMDSLKVNAEVFHHVLLFYFNNNLINQKQPELVFLI